MKRQAAAAAWALLSQSMGGTGKLSGFGFQVRNNRSPSMSDGARRDVVLDPDVPWRRGVKELGLSMPPPPPAVSTACRLPGSRPRMQLCPGTELQGTLVLWAEAQSTIIKHVHVRFYVCTWWREAP